MLDWKQKLFFFISVINQLDAHNFFFHNKFYFMPLHVSSTMCSSSGGQNCITQPVAVSCTGWERKHVEEWNKLIVKQKFCASIWLITEINILRCSTVSKTSQTALLSPTVINTKGCPLQKFIKFTFAAVKFQSHVSRW